MKPALVAVLAALIGGVLVTGSAASAAPPSPVAIQMTVDNDDGSVSLLEFTRPVSAHLLDDVGSVLVAITIDPETELTSDYRGVLSAPDGLLGAFESVCTSPPQLAIDRFRCTFVVPIKEGLNRVDFSLTGFGVEPAVVHGSIVGAPFGAEARLLTRQVGGSWEPLPSGSVSTLRGEPLSALGYSVQNSGALPFVVEGSCSDRQVNPDEELVCDLRSPRPGYALVGRYSVSLRIVDETRTPVDLTLRGWIEVDSERDARATPAPGGLDVPTIAVTALGLALLATPLAVLLRRRLRAS